MAIVIHYSTVYLLQLCLFNFLRLSALKLRLGKGKPWGCRELCPTWSSTQSLCVFMILRHKVSSIECFINVVSPFLFISLMYKYRTFTGFYFTLLCWHTYLLTHCLQPTWPVGRYRPSTRPLWIRSYNWSRDNWCVLTSVNCCESTHPTTEWTPATSTHSPSGMQDATWVKQRQQDGFGKGWKFALEFAASFSMWYFLLFQLQWIIKQRAVCLNWIEPSSQVMATVDISWSLSACVKVWSMSE